MAVSSHNSKAFFYSGSHHETEASGSGFGVYGFLSLTFGANWSLVQPCV